MRSYSRTRPKNITLSTKQLRLYLEIDVLSTMGWLRVGARGSEAQRAEAPARHQGRSTYRGLSANMNNKGGLSGNFQIGGLSAKNIILGCICVYLDIPGVYL